MRWIRAAAAALVLVALLVIPPWALVSFIGNPWPAEGISLSAPFTDAAIIGLLAVAVWVLWAQLVVCVVVETIAALSADRIQLRAPLTMGVQQQFARRLVTALVVATVSTPVVLGGAATAATDHAPQTTAGTPAHLADDAQQGRRDNRDRAGVGDRQDRPAGHSDRGQPPVETPEARAGRDQATVTVMRLDTLMGIADRVLGDEDRWEEIADLNEGRVMDDAGTVFRSADYIRPGWELRIPADATPAVQAGPGGRHVVEAGDTLSEIAQDRLGAAGRYPEIFQASRSITQPGGEHLVDPDHIEPGWVVQLPGQHNGTGPHQQPRGAQNGADLGNAGGPGLEDREHAPADPGGGGDGGQAGPGQQNEDEQVQDEQAEQTADAAADKQQEDEGELTALSALLATAACLSVGALGLVAANRRRQFRRRPIGRTIASTPDELLEVEQAILEHGSEAQEDVAFLDRALRHVAASYKVAGNRLPQLGAAVLGEQDLTLLFTQPAPEQAPEGWTATDDARAWMLPRWTFLEQDLENQPAPYPALVSIGQDESGRTWYLDLETLGMCGIGGEPQQVADMARFMVAELAVNDWSEGCAVLLADQFAAEAIRLNPARLRQVDRSDALARAAVLTGEMGEVEQNLDADVLTRRRDGLAAGHHQPGGGRGGLPSRRRVRQ